MTLLPHALKAVEKGTNLVPDGPMATVENVDALVLATGFDVVAMATSVKVVGRNGFELSRAWDPKGPDGGPSAYYGIEVADVPNAFFCLGPNTGLGHNSIVFVIECQVQHILRVIRETHRRKAKAVEVRPEAQTRFVDEMVRALGPSGDSVWSKCKSWYNLEGGRNITLWPGAVTAYWWRTKSPNFADFEFR